MDKQLLKAYIRTIVEEEVQRILPELLSEAVSQIKGAKINESSTPAPKTTPKKSGIDRGRLAELMGLDYDRKAGVLTAGTSRSAPEIPNAFMVTDDAGNARTIPASAVDPAVRDAITKDYSQLMKAMKI